MVEQTRQQRRAISLQAGPSEVDGNSLLDENVRMNAGEVRVIGRRLAEMGDQLNREWAGRSNPNRWPPPLRMARPAHALTRDLYRAIGGQLWAIRSWSAVMKARWGILRAEDWAAWVSSIQPASCTGWSTRILVAMALVATATICTAFWEN